MNYNIYMKIGKFKFTNGIFLAPMAGVTDVAFRSICKEFGADSTYTEMVSAKGLIYGDEKFEKQFNEQTFSEDETFLNKNILNKEFIKNNKDYVKNKTAALFLTEENETPKVVQLFGSDPEIMAKACRHPLIQKFDIIDINMGCPAPKIIRNGEGSKLMENFELAEKIIKACKAATNKPITVKFRKGFKKDVAVLFAKMCEKAGADAITIHARLASEMYSGSVDLECVKQVKAAVKIPVIGSGDVKDKESFIKMKQTGVDAVMIGRGALGRPYIFKELKDDVNFNLKEKIECAKKHIEILRKYFKEEFLTKYMRKHMLWYASGGQNKQLKAKLAVSENLDESLELLKKILS
ncbi:MAG: tRNA-dihydrouridine synthase family protein [Clostridia bacterium]|nr:tRNA-dihydrouridine synthase family protein [Clostridia bacterium]